jgi:hypothetical protein
MPDESTKRSSSRERLPGISAKFDAVSAGKLWNFAVGKEMSHLEHPRTGAEGTRRLIGPEGTSFTKFNTYVDVDKTPGKRMQRFSQDLPVKSAPEASTHNGDEEPRKDWEGKYRFFSRPYNVEKQSVQGFENYRMRQLFPLREHARHDPVIDHNPLELQDVQLKDVERDYQATVSAAVEQLQEVRKERGREAQFAGALWHKYKYFSGGFQYPNTGQVNRFYKEEPRPASFLRGTAPVPTITPSLIRNKYK